ncbi:MAG TPA: 4-(cytidine 5'-diphospho)-2-C-methyl-D-erythritol kinase [Chitinophagaceae bacterium]|nr:4-(cytidine 5'-diphospho)-2-C-methyl-D-erythritol kinase [Chitinophagaceae bacterium]
MIVFPNCKINLGLRILRKRTDGYHDLETVFYPLPFTDILEILESTDNNSKLSFSTTGLPVESNLNNLCVKSFEMLKKDFPQLPGAIMHLHKVIPLGGGLGGGSADAAFTLKLMNEKFNLGLSTEELINYALQIGSDCPFFIINKPAYATGRGELLEEVQLDLSAFKFIIVNPGITVSTSSAFGGIESSLPQKSVREIIQQPMITWKRELENDFEKSIFNQYPEIGVIKNKLYDNGALYASMSGSGSTVYGIYDKEINVDIDFPSHYFIKQLNS